MTVCGLVSETGRIRGGIGFALTHVATGTYAIGFLEPYDDPPVVVVAPQAPAHVAAVAPTAIGAEVRITDLEGRAADSAFGFVAEPTPRGTS
jgi:hypothetical protein